MPSLRLGQRLAPAAFAVLAAALCRVSLAAATAPPPPQRPPSAEGTFRAFGTDGQIEIRDAQTDTANEAMRRALAVIAADERLTDPTNPQSPITTLNAAAGKAKQTLAEPIVAELARARAFCLWSDRRHGPLAGELYRLAHSAQATAAQVDDASQLTECGRLEVDVAKHTAWLAAGSRIDLTGFGAGLAADDAVEALRAAGVTNAIIRIGPLWRAMGGGPDGKCWWVVLPILPGSEAPPEHVCLRDEALVSVRRGDAPLSTGTAGPSYLDGRSGRPAGDVLAVFVITPLAANALPLAVTLYIAGSRAGELMVGSVDPPPAVLWVEGSGEGEPLFLPHRWSRVTKR
jgi:thiamine biosynthesis lipoprotein ApbE